jgi:uncharacterized protein (DUF305 family)
MKHTQPKSAFLALAIATISSLGSLLAACSPPNATSSQPQATSPAVTNAGNKPMDHGNMNHGSMGGMNHNMDLGPADAEFDLRFIDSMIPHHEGAVVMAKEVLQKSKRPELQKLAQDIINAQTKEIAQMQSWRTAWYPKAPSQPVAWHSQMGHSMAMTEDQRKSMMMSMDLGAADAEFDLRFLNAMIPHHEGAVVMAQEVLTKSKRPDVLTLAKEISASQKAEIAQMKQWRKTWYNQ